MERLKLVVPAAETACDVSIVMPCLNEARSIPICIANAKAALAEMREKLGLTGEIIIADNGSEDASSRLAAALGARVVAVAPRGYGAALIAGFREAQGRYLVMGDADGSYDFRDAVEMVREARRRRGSVHGLALCRRASSPARCPGRTAISAIRR